MIHTRPGNEKLTFYTGRVPGQPLYNYLFLLRLKIGTKVLIDTYYPLPTADCRLPTAFFVNAFGAQNLLISNYIQFKLVEKD